MRCAGVWGRQRYVEELRVQLLQHVRYIERIVTQLPAIVNFQPLELQNSSNKAAEQWRC
jgi:hypothetical protein